MSRNLNIRESIMNDLEREVIHTCIIAAFYDGGIVLAADRRVSRGTMHAEEPKMFLVHKGEIAIAFAGKSSIYKKVKNRLTRSRKFNDAKTIGTAVDEAEKVFGKVFVENSDSGTYTARELTLLEALLCGLSRLSSGRPELFRFNYKGQCEPIWDTGSEQHYAIGQAKDCAHSLAKLFHSSENSQEKTVEMLSYIIHQASVVDASVGEGPDIVIVEDGKKPVMFKPERVQEIREKAIDTSGDINLVLSKLFGETEFSSRTLRKLFEREETYRVFGAHFIEDLAGIVRNNRRIGIVLEHDVWKKSPIIRGKTLSSYDAESRADIETDLFSIQGEKGVLYKGNVTIPQPLLKRPKDLHDPTMIWDILPNWKGHITGVQIDKEDEHPKSIVKWKKDSYPSKGLSFQVILDKKIQPGETKEVSWTTRCVYDMQDYMARRFSSYGQDAELLIEKPEDLKINVVWFLTTTRKKLSVETGEAEITPTSYRQKIKGNIVPGNGFIVTWWPEKKV